MKKDLEYFTIEGAFGGNQDWFTNVVMHIGGCAAATACDCCIYLALRKNLGILYPYSADRLTKKDYISFSQRMKPYIRPRVSGVKKVEWFIDGFEKYIEDVKAGNMDMTDESSVKVNMEVFSGERSYEEAWDMIVGQINAGYPVPYLLLRHQKAERYKDYIWHWFLLVGYEEKEDDLFVKTATYGESDTFSFRELWDTRCAEKGGMVRLGTG